MKQRLNIYPLSNMADGDLFYLQRDRKKTLLRLNDVRPFEVKNQAGYKKTYANCRKVYPEPGQLQVEQHLSGTYAVFVRNINEQAKKSLTE